MRRRIPISAAIIWLAAGAATADEAAVGDWGHPQRVTIEGAETFTPEEIRNALFRDLQVLLASHPLAPRSGMAPALEQRLLAGLLHAGFAEARVAARLDEAQGGVIAQVSEGPRYTNAGVRIVGAIDVPSEELHARLTQPYPAKEAVQAQFFDRGDEREVRWLDKDGQAVDLAKPVWTAGTNAQFDEAARRRYRDHMRQALAELGFPFATFDVTVVPDPATRTAEMAVVLADEGPPAEISEIEVAGAEKNSRAAILAWLEIKPGELITHLRRADLERRLWESGRFLEQRVVLIPPEENRPAKMRIEVKEYTPAPPLDASLSREEAALVKTRNWLNEMMRGNENEIVIQLEDERGYGRVVLAPHRGFALSIGQRGDDGQSKSKAALLLSEGETGIYLPGDGFRLSSQVEQIQLTSSAALSLTGGENPFRFNLGFGFRTLKEGEQALPLDVAISAAPVFFVGLAHERNATVSWEGEVLTITNDFLRLRIDSREGRVLEWIELGPDGETKPSPVSLAVGEFARERERVLAAIGDAPNVYRSDAPISSLIGGLADERVLRLLLQFARGGESAPSEKEKAGVARLRLVRKLAERGVLRPLDDIFAGSPADKKKDKLTIPADVGEQPAPQQFFGHLAVTLGLPAAEVLFPRDSWPWTLARETALTLSGRSNYLAAELDRLYASPETGPLSCLAVAALLKKSGMPHAAAFASRGLAEMAPDDFLRDCRPLIDPDAAVGQCVRQCAAVLRALDDEEIEQLSRSLLKDDGVILQAAARELRRSSDEPLATAIPRALAAAWESGLRQQVRTALESHLPADTFRIGGKP